ncbi:MAG: class I SAM-dependent methyltransferase [Ignavibacterium sp.]
MKYHDNLFVAIIDALEKIFYEKKFADKVIEQTFKINKKWGARDRSFVAATIYDVIRWWRLLLELLDLYPQYISSVRLGRDQLFQLIGVLLILTKQDLPTRNEFSNLNANEILNRYEKFKSIRKIRESIPDWLDELGERELGQKWDNEIKALNETAKVFLRVNTISKGIDTPKIGDVIDEKTGENELQKILLSEGIKTEKVDGFPNALMLTERKNVFTTQSFKNGLFEIQDVASQYVSLFLDLQPGMRVIDACAGGGGKSLHIAAIMKNKGKIISLDTEEWKLQELKRRARRNGIDIIETRVINSMKVIKRLNESADRLLLDVPCSGLGVLRRNPDAKWKLSIEKINSLINRQEKILNDYSSMIKKGGILVYATCSIFPSENEKQIEKFLIHQKEKFDLLDEKNFSPFYDGYDGFYMAKLIRKK